MTGPSAAGGVARICNLLHRGFPIRRALEKIFRASRLQTCDTADCKSAIRTRWLREYGTFGLAALVLAACALLTSRQLTYWQNTTTLFEHALPVTSKNACAHFSLGNETGEPGQDTTGVKGVGDRHRDRARPRGYPRSNCQQPIPARRFHRSHRG